MATGDGLARVTYLPGAMPAPPVAAEPPHFNGPEPGDLALSNSQPSKSQPSKSRSRNLNSPNPHSPNVQSRNVQSRNPSSGSAEPEGLERDELERDQLERDQLGLDQLERDELGRDELGLDQLERDQLGRDQLGRDATERRAENVSLGALTRRGMSRWELEKTLLSRDLDESVVAQELERLERVGLIDDLALAETVVRTQHERKGLGRSALIAELRRRHLPQDAIDAALEQVGDVDEQAMATELAVKRAGQLSTYDVDTAKRRLTAFLMRKGYSSSIVRLAVDTALGGRARTVKFR